MKNLSYIIIGIVSIFILFLFSFWIYFEWPNLKSQYYLKRSEEAGKCYRIYKGKLDFVTITELKRVYRHTIPGVDVSSFEVIGNFCDTIYDCLHCEIWAKDANQVYYRTSILKDADPITFIPLSQSGFSKDQKRVFFRDKTLSNADARTFEVIKAEYGRDSKFVYYKDKALTVVKNPKSFEIIDHYCWKDDSLIYLKGKKIPEADPESFSSIDCNDYTGKYKFLAYKDKKNGYILDLNKDPYQRLEMRDHKKVYIIENIDTKTFSPCPYKYYSKDKDHIYFKNRKIENVIPGNFKILGQFYSVHLNKVYFKDSLLLNANPDKLEIKGHLLAVDETNVFFEGKLVESASPEFIKPFNDYYFTDGKSVFYKCNKLSMADISTFKIISTELIHEAKDALHHYRKGKIVK